MSNYNTSEVFNGLGTFVIGVGDTGTYTLQGTITLPSISQGASGNSSVVVTITTTGAGLIYTGAAGAKGFEISNVSAAAGDTISIALSSANAVDQGLNIIKTTVTVSEI